MLKVYFCKTVCKFLFIPNILRKNSFYPRTTVPIMTLSMWWCSSRSSRSSGGGVFPDDTSGPGRFLEVQACGVVRCRYALISTRLSLPKCWVSYWASIKCLLRRRLPWYSDAFQSNDSSTLSFRPLSFYLFGQKKKKQCRLHQPTVVPSTPSNQLFRIERAALPVYLRDSEAWMAIWGWLDEPWRELLQADTFGWRLVVEN